MIQFNEKTFLKKQKLFAILSREQYSLQKWQVYCLHLIPGEVQGLAGKFTVTKQPLLPGFDINTISKAHNLPIERYEQECKVSEFRKCTKLN